MKLSEIKLTEFSVTPYAKVVTKQAVAVGVVVLVLVLVTNTAMAAGGFSVDDTGKKADTFIKNIVKWAVIIAGGVGAVILLAKFIQAWNDRLDWMDFIKFALFYAAAGSVATIAATLYGAFS